MRLHDIKVKPIRILPFEVAQKGFTETSRLHHTAHALSSEEGVEFCDGAVERLRCGAALEFKVHLFDGSMGLVV